MKKITITTLIILASFGLAVSGCVKKPVTQPVNQNQNANQNINANTNTATSTVEIDTSNWKIYRNEEYGFEFKYPEDFVKFDYPNQLNNLILNIDNQDFNYPYGSDGDARFSVRIYDSDLSLKDWFIAEGRYSDIDINKKINLIQQETSQDYISINDIVINDYDAKIGEHESVVRYVKFLKPEYGEGPAYTHKVYNFKIDNHIIIFEVDSPTGRYSDGVIDFFDKFVVRSINFF